MQEVGSFSRNRILFGAPGTGKSYTLKKDCEKLIGNNKEAYYERVTFHPDYSYANFVGTYKPTMVDNFNEQIDEEENYVLSVLTDSSKSAQEKYDALYDKFNKDRNLTRLPILLGLYTDDDDFETKKISAKLTKDNNHIERNHGRAIRPYVKLIGDRKREISYEYVPGPFMRVLVKALKNIDVPHLLIIEEINRANVAAVFGDIFQLLDRDSDGNSEYEITTTQDMRRYLSEQLGPKYNTKTIIIPSNMYIWATMNSADQGVYPMDTAFKRRWDFTYLGVDDNDEWLNGKYVYLAENGSQKIEWNKLRKAINNFLAKEKINEDKQLGPYFISTPIIANSNEIDRDQFINIFKNKVIMYLFEDAARQKRSRLFEGCLQCNRFSEICKEFEEKGIYIFNKEIQESIEIDSEI